MRNLFRVLPSAGVFLTFLCAGCSNPPDSTIAAEMADGSVGQLTAEVRTGSGAYTVRGINSVTIRFRNTGPKSVSILKPLDGSIESWHMPYYSFTVMDEERRPLKPMMRCGNSGLWADSQWPQDYLVEIKAGACFDIEVPLPYMVENDGPHTISFEYVYQPKNEQFAPPPGAWRGSITADPVILNLKRP
jgi:hypothetical protein